MAQDLFRMVSEKRRICYGFLNGIQEVACSIHVRSTNENQACFGKSYLSPNDSVDAARPSVTDLIRG
jgi:hypothetical protein